MPNVTISPIKTINVRVNQSSQKTVTSTSQFVGASNIQNEVNQIKILAQNASDTANVAIILADEANANVDSKLSLTGGTITGNLEITQNLTVDNIITANNETIDAGLF